MMTFLCYENILLTHRGISMDQKGKTGSRKAIAVTALLFLAYFMSAFFKTSANIVVPHFQRTIGLSASMAGLISGMFFFPYSFLQLATGSLSEKFGPVRICVAGLLISVLGTALWAFASNTFMVVAGRLFQGLGFGPIYLGTISYLSYTFDTKRFAMFSGLATLFANIGSAFSSVPLQKLINSTGIRPTFLSTSAVVLVLAAVLFLLRPNRASLPEMKSSMLAEYEDTMKTWLGKSPIIIGTILWAIPSGVILSFSGLWGTEWTAMAFPEFASSASSSLLLICFGMMAGGLLGGTIFPNPAKRTAYIRLNSMLECLFMILLTVSLGLRINLMLSLALCFLVGTFNAMSLIQVTAFVRELTGSVSTTMILGIFNFVASWMVLLFQWFSGILFDAFSTNMNANSAFFASFSILCVIFIGAALSSLGLDSRQAHRPRTVSF